MSSLVRVCCLSSCWLENFTAKIFQTARSFIRGTIQRQTRVLAKVPCRGIERPCHGAERVLKVILKAEIRSLGSWFAWCKQGWRVHETHPNSETASSASKQGPAGGKMTGPVFTLRAGAVLCTIVCYHVSAGLCLWGWIVSSFAGCLCHATWLSK